MRKLLFFISIILFGGKLFASTINIIAAENFYGKLAKEIGGNYVQVKNIIDNPNADPHLFATSPSISQNIAKAQIIIYNGADYDDWMDQILKAQTNKNLMVINVADLLKIKTGANPHIWYEENTMPLLAQTLAERLIILNPLATTQIKNNLQKFLASYVQVEQKIKLMKSNYSNIYVTATEPVFNYMATAIGLKMLGIDFQWKIMNGTEPSPKILAAYQTLLTQRKVKVLFYNNQVKDVTTNNMLILAKKNGIKIVGVNETMPSNVTVSQWFLKQLVTLDEALKS